MHRRSAALLVAHVTTAEAEYASLIRPSSADTCPAKVAERLAISTLARSGEGEPNDVFTMQTNKLPPLPRAWCKASGRLASVDRRGPQCWPSPVKYGNRDRLGWGDIETVKRSLSAHPLPFHDAAAAAARTFRAVKNSRN